MSSPATVTSPDGGLVEAGEDVHERRLARARGAHDGGQPTTSDVERHAAQGVDGGVALAVAAHDVARRDHGLGDLWILEFGLHEDGLHGDPFMGFG